jgi:hypothetical protein
MRELLWIWIWLINTYKAFVGLLQVDSLTLTIYTYYYAVMQSIYNQHDVQPCAGGQ